jgi:hypothetical protein
LAPLATSMTRLAGSWAQRAQRPTAPDSGPPWRHMCDNADTLRHLDTSAHFMRNGARHDHHGAHCPHGAHMCDNCAPLATLADVCVSWHLRGHITHPVRQPSSAPYTSAHVGAWRPCPTLCARVLSTNSGVSYTTGSSSTNSGVKSRIWFCQRIPGFRPCELHDSPENAGRKIANR